LKQWNQWKSIWLIWLFLFFFFSFWRDVRRLVVAMSRARLGLYIFARVSLFQNCFELTPAFSQLTARPLHLHIIPTECFPAARQVGTTAMHFSAVLVAWLYFPWCSIIHSMTSDSDFEQRVCSLRGPQLKISNLAYNRNSDLKK